MSTRTQAYKFVVTLNGDAIAGLETTQLKITPNFEEELIKSNLGNPAKTLKDFDVELVCGCKTYNQSGDEDFETIRAYSAAGAEHDFSYTDGTETITGKCKVVDHSENTDSLATGTWNVTLKAVKGTVVFSNES